MADLQFADCSDAHAEADKTSAEGQNAPGQRLAQGLAMTEADTFSPSSNART